MKLLLKATWVPVCYQNYNISDDTSTVTLESQVTTMNKGKGPTQAYIVNSFELTPLCRGLGLIHCGVTSTTRDKAIQILIAHNYISIAIPKT